MGKRETGEPVDGSVTAASRDVARDVLSENGIVAESLEPESVSPAHPPEPVIDDASVRVSFDYATRGYRGKSVGLVDQEKIRTHLMKLVDDGLIENLEHDENRREARHHIVEMLEKLLQRPDLPSERSAWFRALETQVGTLIGAVGRIERSMASMSPSAPRHRRGAPHVSEPKGRTMRQEILMKVFESNLELIRGLKDPASAGVGETLR